MSGSLESDTSSSWCSAPQNAATRRASGELRVLTRKAHGKRLDRPVHHAGHQRDDQARVEPAAQHRSQRDVAHQAHADRLLEPCEQQFAPFIHGQRARIGIRHRIAPPALDANPAVFDDEALARPELPHTAQRREWTRDVSEREVGGNRLGIEVVVNESAGDDALELGPEHDDVVDDRVVERLDPEPIADQHTPAALLIPHGDREHPAEALAQLRSVLLVEVREYLRVAPAPQHVAALLSSERRLSWL